MLSLRLQIIFFNLATSSKSPAHSSTGTRSVLKYLPLFVSIGFHVLFHSPTGVLFTFPSRYYFTIGHLGVFSLTRWSSLIHTGFHVSHATRDKHNVISLRRIYKVCKNFFKLQDFHLLWCRIQLLHIKIFVFFSCFPTTPM